MDEFVTVSITAGSAGEAEAIAGALVAERLAACVQTHPVTSRYRWQGEVQSDLEVMLVAKTRKALLEALIARVLALHSYDVPEIVALPIVGGHGPYLDWIAAQTRVEP